MGSCSVPVRRAVPPADPSAPGGARGPARCGRATLEGEAEVVHAPEDAALEADEAARRPVRHADLARPRGEGAEVLCQPHDQVAEEPVVALGIGSGAGFVSDHLIGSPFPASLLLV